MSIECATAERMVEVVHQLIQKGIVFKARDLGTVYLIELTGGY